MGKSLGKEQVPGRKSGASAELSLSSIRHHMLSIERSLFSNSLNKPSGENYGHLNKQFSEGK